MKKIGVAIIGCGMIAESHAKSVLKDERAFLAAAAYGPARERGEVFAKMFNIPVLVEDYRDLLLRDDIDMVCVCTPSSLHGESTVEFLNAGKAALVEKPLDITSEAITLMEEAAKRNGLPLGCVFGNRTRKGLMKAKALLDSGALGDMYVVECQYRLNGRVSLNTTAAVA
jgi:predicted dehydrogenase